jgi:hypothetical protein
MPHRLAAASRAYWGKLHCARTAEATGDGSVSRGFVGCRRFSNTRVSFWFASSWASSCSCKTAAASLPRNPARKLIPSVDALATSRSTLHACTVQ